MKYAFLPFNRGLAHVTRSLMIAAELQRQGHEVKCWLPDSHKHFADEVGVPVQPDEPIMAVDHSGGVDRLLDVDFLTERAKQLRPQLEKYAPDMAIVDFHTPGLVAARSLDVPIMYITHTTGLSDGFEVPNPGLWSPLFAVSKPFVGFMAKKMFNKYVASMDKSLSAIVGHKSLAFEGVNYLFPEPRGYLRTRLNIPEDAYSGPLLWPAFDEIALPKQIEKFPKEKTIYITGGGTGWSAKFTAQMVTAFLDNDYYVAVTTGERFSKSEFPDSDRLVVADYLPGSQMAARCSVMVCHGGYGTLVQAVVNRTPTVSVPVNVDQLVHASRWHQLGYGIRVWPANVRRVFMALTGKHEAFENSTETIPLKTILEAVQEAAELSLPEEVATIFDYTESPKRAAKYIVNL